MAVKRKGEWHHASEREGWVFVGLRLWLEAAPLYWTTTSFLFFFSELKKICMWPGYFSSTWLWRKLISVKCKVNSGKRVFVHPPHSRAVIKQLKMWYITSNSIHSSMMPLMWVGVKLISNDSTGVMALWMASGEGWSSMADAPDKCSRSGTIFPNIHSEMTFLVFLRMKACSHKD